MPNWTGSPISTRSVTVGFLAAGGDQASVQLADLNSAVSDGQVTALKTALAELSNAVAIATQNTLNTRVSIAAQNPYDESYSSAGMKLVLQFQDAGLNMRSIAIPAPDETLFGGDGVTAIIPDDAGSDAQVALDAAIDAVLAVLNTGGGSFAYVGGYRVERARSAPRARIVRPTVEPDGGEPGDGPGELPTP